MEKYGFVYIWFDRKHKRYYIGCHWGTEDDGYICSSSWMKAAYLRRPKDFKRRIIKNNLTREQMYLEEGKYLSLIKPEEIKTRYYNLKTHEDNLWHQYPESVKTIGQKISYSKKGKSIGPCSEETKAKISKSNKGRVFTEEHKEKLRQAKLGKKHTEEWKQQNSERMKRIWSDGTRKRAEPKKTMNRKEQDKLCSQQLKNRWSDPVWAANQRAKLKEAWVKRKQNINNEKEPNQSAVL